MAKKAAKKYRRFIRINGTVKGSPEFDSKAKADDWYEDQKARRKLIKKGRIAPDSPTFLQFTAAWIQQRMDTYGPETWGPDDQRLRDYLLPELADYKLDSITRAKCRETLRKITDEKGRSRSTRTRVQALLSKIFNDALNHDPPYVTGNPVTKMQFNEKRKGTKKPTTLEDWDEVMAYAKTALELSETHFVIVCIFLMSGIRRQELIALKWRNVKWKGQALRISAKYVEARRAIVEGTKSGEDETRDVPVSLKLLEVLETWRTKTPFKAESDFVVSSTVGKNKGSHIDPQVLYSMVKEVGEKFGRADIGMHSLRHTYGRLFVQKTGNQKALQTILGHASSATTDIYSELSGGHVQPFAETMTLDVPGISDAPDTRMTQKTAKKGRK